MRRRHPSVWVPALAGLSCGLSLALSAQAETPDQVAVAKTLDAFHAAAAKADGKAYFDLFASDGVFIGTDVTERWSVPAFKTYAEPHFAQGHGWVYASRKRHVSIADCRCVAWFDEVLDSKSYGAARGTGVLVATPRGWKISQYALTFPIPNDLADDFTSKIKAYEAKPKP